MATGYTQIELDALLHAMDSEVPGVPRRADKVLADRVKAMRAAGTEKGALFAFEFKRGVTEHFWFNVWIAKEPFSRLWYCRIGIRLGKTRAITRTFRSHPRAQN